MLRGRSGQSALLVLTVLGTWIVALLLIGRAAGMVGAADRYDVPLWITRNLSRHWLNGPARRLGGGFDEASAQQIVNFFGATSDVAAAETDLAYDSASGHDASAAERQFRLRVAELTGRKAPVEARLAAQLSGVARTEGLATNLPLYNSLQFVWPPVTFSYDLPPYLLIRSRRDRIELLDTTLLRSDLSQTEIDRLERQAEAGGDSALIVRVGGVATYPSIVEEDDTYDTSLELIAHEWTHQYLFFHPLGVRYFQSRAMTTINETVANMVGQELAAAVRARFPLASSPTRVRSSAPAADRTVDFDRTMHQLRVEVDSLLAAGQVSEAEQRMNDTRAFLAAHGYYLPVINQAYFAFYGTYANTAASTSPIGPQLATLRTHYRSLSDFVHAVQSVESPEDLQRLLSASGG